MSGFRRSCILRLVTFFAFSLAFVPTSGGAERKRAAAKRPRIVAPTLESAPQNRPPSESSAGSPRYFSVLQDKARKIEERNTNEGWAYVISGGLALAISIPGYYLSDDVFARSVYSLGETLAVASIGYGAYLVLVADDYARFARILQSSPTLSLAEKDRLSFEFMNENAKRAKAVRKIRVISHALTAGLNFLNGATTDSRELRTALYFIGGINVLASLSYLFRESEEEKFLDEIRNGGKVEAFIGVTHGPMLGLKYRF